MLGIVKIHIEEEAIGNRQQIKERIKMSKTHTFTTIT
jgi:hypothetical protein